MEEAAPNAEKLDELIDALLDEDEHKRYEAARKVSEIGRPIIARFIELTERFLTSRRGQWRG